MVKSVKGLARATQKNSVFITGKESNGRSAHKGKRTQSVSGSLELLCPRFLPKRVGAKIFPFDFLCSSQVSYTFLMGRAWVVVTVQDGTVTKFQ